MDTQRIDSLAQQYIDKNWEQVIADIAALIRIPSHEDLGHADEAAGQPYGPGPALALEAVLKIAADMGFATCNCQGHVGFADWEAPADPEGQAAPQYAMIGHMDTVPVGPGWTFDPHDLTRKEGYLIGRGIMDDKGPTVMALHALRCLKDAGMTPRCSWRFIFGASEETTMSDVAYYRARYDDPAFLLTPDASFPVSYGEKGILHALLISAPIQKGRIAAISGGTAPNAVPGTASATLIDGQVIEMVGKGAHASTPQLGINAIDMLITELLQNGQLTPNEQRFLEFCQTITSRTDGQGVGLACEDEHFGALTAIGSMIGIRDGRLTLCIDVRFPTVIDEESIKARIRQTAGDILANIETLHVAVPFLIDPRSPQVKMLMEAYNDITGEDASPFTMAGGTYAREFSCAVSFGIEKPWLETPEWAGGMHGANEALSESLLQESFRIYVRALAALSQ